MTTRDELLAEASAVRQLLGLVPPDNVLDVASLQARIENLEEEAEELRAQTHRPRVDLYFRGAPVIGTRGIDASFAAAVVDRYSDAVQARAADLRGNLKALGPVPMRSNHRMFIVEKIAGSCGFTLEAIQQDLAADDEEALRKAIGDVDAVIAASLVGDEALSDAIESTHDRVLSHVRDFLKACCDWDAGFKIAEPNRASIETSGATEIRMAAERLAIATATTEITMIGTLRGMLPGPRRFEFQEEGQERSRGGRIDDVLSVPEIDRLHEEFLHKRCLARFRVTKIGPRMRFALLNLEEVKKNSGGQ